MVSYSEQAFIDLDEILEGLFYWDKIDLSRELCRKYVSDIIDVCDNLDKLPIHLPTKYETHKKYGKFVYLYKRNTKTQWNIIYNKETNNNIYIEKIINNYKTEKQ
jgi:mRNA-degrading endonuclease YafQ of YafQ-DinJ toxin-antitoxin module